MNCMNRIILFYLSKLFEKIIDFRLKLKRINRQQLKKSHFTEHVWIKEINTSNFQK